MNAVVRDARGRPRLDWAIDSEARGILSTCAEADRDVLWAVGALELSHAWDFTAWPPDPMHFAPACAGSQLPRGRWYAARRGGWRIYRHVKTAITLTEADIVSGGWPEVVRPVTAARVGTRLVDAIAAARAARERMALAHRHDEPRLPAEVVLEQGRAWGDVERCCYDLAAQVWDRLRPDWALLDRFDLAGTA